MFADSLAKETIKSIDLDDEETINAINKGANTLYHISQGYNLVSAVILDRQGRPITNWLIDKVIELEKQLAFYQALANHLDVELWYIKKHSGPEDTGPKRRLKVVK